MRRLDRLGWAAGLRFDAYGVRVGVRVNQPQALPALERLLPPGARPAASPDVEQLHSVWIGEDRGRTRAFHLLYSGIERRARTLSLDALHEAFETGVRLGVAAAARRRVFVHAGVVGWRGRAILLPGRSGSGKTTLVAALLREGATYYSDEFAVLDERGYVHPFAKPLSVRDGGRARKEPAEAFGGGGTGTAALPVGLIAFGSYGPGRRWRARPLSPGQALLALIPHTVPVRRRPEATLAVLRRTLDGARPLKVARGEAEDAAPRLLRQAGGWPEGAA
jgi:hypothetical protein